MFDLFLLKKSAHETGDLFLGFFGLVLSLANFGFGAGFDPVNLGLGRVENLLRLVLGFGEIVLDILAGLLKGSFGIGHQLFVW